ncbi:hypothetical protein A0H81_08896 [Grifola frondosa]|uniref:Uncharacterized protein n=1 Tax=Grifola frondosa TaxID=5627 RepID=A0A1C7M3T2_GRIFR|nr:hypothetical protein A0H81_08896 [Grifola frondosa]
MPPEGSRILPHIVRHAEDYQRRTNRRFITIRDALTAVCIRRIDNRTEPIALAVEHTPANTFILYVATNEGVSEELVRRIRAIWSSMQSLTDAYSNTSSADLDTQRTYADPSSAQALVADHMVFNISITIHDALKDLALKSADSGELKDYIVLRLQRLLKQVVHICPSRREVMEMAHDYLSHLIKASSAALSHIRCLMNGNLRLMMEAERFRLDASWRRLVLY